MNNTTDTPAAETAQAPGSPLVPFMDDASQRRSWIIGKRLGKLPFNTGWELLYEPQAELGGRSCKQAADEGMFDEIDTLIAKYENAVGWRSCAQWPDGLLSFSYADHDNTTRDRHDTGEQAAAVCGMLRKQGLGGERIHFPVKTWVEPVFAENKDFAA